MNGKGYGSPLKISHVFPCHNSFSEAFHQQWKLKTNRLWQLLKTQSWNDGQLQAPVVMSLTTYTMIKACRNPPGCKTDKWIQLHAHPSLKYNNITLHSEKKTCSSGMSVCDRCYTFSYMILRYQHLSGMLGRWQCICQGPRLHKSQAATNVFSKSQGSSAILGPKEMAATIFHLRKWIWNGTPEREKLGTISGSKLAAKSYPQAWSTPSMKCLHTLNSTQCWKSAAASR